MTIIPSFIILKTKIKEDKAQNATHFVVQFLQKTISILFDISCKYTYNFGVAMSKAHDLQDLLQKILVEY